MEDILYIIENTVQTEPGIERYDFSNLVPVNPRHRNRNRGFIAERAVEIETDEKVTDEENDDQEVENNADHLAIGEEADSIAEDKDGPVDDEDEEVKPDKEAKLNTSDTAHNLVAEATKKMEEVNKLVQQLLLLVSSPTSCENCHKTGV